MHVVIHDRRPLDIACNAQRDAARAARRNAAEDALLGCEPARHRLGFALRHLLDAVGGLVALPQSDLAALWEALLAAIRDRAYPGGLPSSASAGPGAAVPDKEADRGAASADAASCGVSLPASVDASDAFALLFVLKHPAIKRNQARKKHRAFIEASTANSVHIAHGAETQPFV